MADIPSLQTLQEMLRLSGIELSRDKLEELAPAVQTFMERLKRLDELDLKDVEPAFIGPLSWE